MKINFTFIPRRTTDPPIWVLLLTFLVGHHCYQTSEIKDSFFCWVVCASMLTLTNKIAYNQAPKRGYNGSTEEVVGSIRRVWKTQAKTQICEIHKNKDDLLLYAGWPAVLESPGKSLKVLDFILVLERCPGKFRNYMKVLEKYWNSCLKSAWYFLKRVLNFFDHF